MSPEYLRAARTLDTTLGTLLRELDLENDPDTLVVALADHGGGGVDPKDHSSDHPHDRVVPLVFAGQRVIPGDLGRDISLLTVPATILWALGLERPSNYGGSPLTSVVHSRHPAVIVA